MTKRKKSYSNPTDSAESATVHELLAAVMDTENRGGLTKLADRIGMPISATRKRMQDPERAFDAPTMRAVLWISSHRSDKAPENSTIIKTTITGNYYIEIRDVDGTPTPYWHPK